MRLSFYYLFCFEHYLNSLIINKGIIYIFGLGLSQKLIHRNDQVGGGGVMENNNSASLTSSVFFIELFLSSKESMSFTKSAPNAGTSIE